MNNHSYTIEHLEIRQHARPNEKPHLTPNIPQKSGQVVAWFVLLQFEGQIVIEDDES